MKMNAHDLLISENYELTKREYLIIMILQGLVSNLPRICLTSEGSVETVEQAINIADTLINTLRKESL